ncbi:hypothetical protein [Paenimyroides baculatum]|uniref:Uncharacterized protein n=1 Tax=Paenimyroides baculatum TaxID=2608000 RepID=A0A5M6CL74_9FLAO|nr:hypothetical protein [Paenimyroides baculatum]KAA5535874.1 hypothetical protein F0460_05400 [Paenimyroides baculatum]
MDKLTQKLLKTFLISGNAFFALLGITFIAVQIWPVIWDEWNAYKKGDDLTSAKITNIRILKNDYYSQTFIDSLEEKSLDLWHEERAKNDMLSPNGAGDYHLETANDEYKLQFINQKDTLVYAEFERSFNPYTNKPLTSTGNNYYSELPFPKDIINDKLQLVLKKKDSVFAIFEPFVLQENLKIGKGFEGRKNKEIKLKSTNGKLIVYVEFELNNQ